MSYLVGNPEDRVSRDEAQLQEAATRSAITALDCLLFLSEY